MRPNFLTAFALCVSLTAAVPSAVEAQSSSAATALFASVDAGGVTGIKVPTAGTPATVVLTGHVKTVAGPLPGAVVKIGNTKTMVVTDADGSFHVTVPANSGPLQATASYAGFADEAVTLGEAANELSMTTPRVIVVAKSQTIKAYRKTARKQVKRSIRRVQRSVK